MTPEHLKILHILNNRQLPFDERYRAAEEISIEVSNRKIIVDDVSMFYRPMITFWRSLGASKIDRENLGLIEKRKQLAHICWRLSLRFPEGRKFFKYYPHVNKAEGFEERIMNKLMVGAISPGYGTSLYEFHWEYPIEGAGIRKDLISVITEKNERIPIMDWCEQNDIIVFCNRCGLDITYKVSKDCPFRKGRFKK